MLTLEDSNARRGRGLLDGHRGGFGAKRRGERTERNLLPGSESRESRAGGDSASGGVVRYGHDARVAEPDVLKRVAS